MKSTALYLRVSTEAQTHDSQLHELRRYFEQRGWADPVEFIDVASGGRTDRDGLEHLRVAVRAGKVARVVVFKLDRLGRSLRFVSAAWASARCKTARSIRQRPPASWSSTSSSRSPSSSAA